jgi:hypothetical protein
MHKDEMFLIEHKQLQLKDIHFIIKSVHISLYETAPPLPPQELATLAKIHPPSDSPIRWLNS